MNAILKRLRLFKDFRGLCIIILNHLSPLVRNDATFIRIKWKLCLDYPLDLEHPRTYNEKLQWLKLYDRKPIYTTMVDKYEAKKYVADIIGDEYIIPTLGVWETVDEIEWDRLPNQFVLKCTHDSGGVLICRDKTQFDINKAKKELRKGLKRDYYWRNREWPYKNVKPRIIAEQYMTDGDGGLKDYKVFNFNGEQKVVEIDYDRFKGHLRNLYTTNWEKIDAVIKYPSDETRVFDKPKVMNELLELSKRLSLGIPHLRTDFYIVDGKVFFGDLTFFHESGLAQISPRSFDEQMGDWIVLPNPMGGGSFGQ